MKKGISPLVASVLLIAITIAIAGILASWVTSYTEETLPTTSCIGGGVAVVSADYPYWNVVDPLTGEAEIVAVIEATSVPLSDFKFAILMVDDTVHTIEDDEGLVLEPGAIGTIKTGDLSTLIPDETQIWAVQITTNCPNVDSGWYDLA